MYVLRFAYSRDVSLPLILFAPRLSPHKCLRHYKITHDGKNGRTTKTTERTNGRQRRTNEYGRTEKTDGGKYGIQGAKRIKGETPRGQNVKRAKRTDNFSV